MEITVQAGLFGEPRFGGTRYWLWKKTFKVELTPKILRDLFEENIKLDKNWFELRGYHAKSNILYAVRDISERSKKTKAILLARGWTMTKKGKEAYKNQGK